MPWLARLDAPGVLHHVMGRGDKRKRNTLERNRLERFHCSVSETSGR